MAEAFIKIYRKMLEWEWYDDPNTCRVFIHCLLRANWKAARWHGIEIQPGQFITSLQNLADETCLSKHQVRVALDHLKMTGEVALTRHSKCSVITIKNWDVYQGGGTHMAFKRHSDGIQVATDKEYKEDKNIKNKKIHNFSERKVDYEELEEIAKSDRG